MSVAEVAWPEYQRHVAAGGIVIIPVGSTEQHGPHLPLGTDALLAEGLATRAAPVIGALVAPTIPYGFRSQPETGGGESFPGSTGIGGATLSTLLADVLASLIEGGCEHIVVLNAHFENAWFIVDGVETSELRTSRRARIVVSRWAPLLREETLRLIAPNGAVDWAREHAGIAETSLLMALRPDLVSAIPHDACLAPASSPYQVFPHPRTLPGHDGMLAPPGGASRAIGEAIVGDVVDGLRLAAEAEFGTGAA